MSDHLKYALYDVPLFAGLEDSGFELLAAGVRESALGAGHIIIQEGDAGSQLFLLRRGAVRAYRLGRHGDVPLTQISAPGFFGEMSILEEMPRSANVQALTPVELMILPRVRFEMLADRFPAQYARMVTNLARVLSSRLRQLGDDFARHH